MKKAARILRGLLFNNPWVRLILLDLAFFVLNVLAYNWVVFVHDHFLGHCAGVLFGHVEVASARCRVQADLDCGWLRHFNAPKAGDALRPINLQVLPFSAPVPQVNSNPLK
jgi:hypothetical protein